MIVLLGVEVIEALYNRAGGIGDGLASEIFSEVESEDINENSAGAGIDEVQRISKISAMNVIDQHQAARINASRPGGIVQDGSLADGGFDDIPAGIDLRASPAKHEWEHSLSQRAGLNLGEKSAGKKEHDCSRSFHGRK